jgi:hypothetical protein
MLNNFAFLLLRPGEAVAALSARLALGTALAVFVLSQISASIAFSLAVGADPSMTWLIDAVGMCGATMALGLVVAAGFHYTLSLQGGSGPADRLTLGLMLAQAPWLLATPAVLLLLPIRSHQTGLYVALFVGTWSGLTLWTVSLKTRLASRTHGLSVTRTFLSYLATYGGLVLLAWLAGSTGPVAIVARMVTLSK